MYATVTLRSGKKDLFGITKEDGWWTGDGFFYMDCSDGATKRIWAIPVSLIESVYITDREPALGDDVAG